MKRPRAVPAVLLMLLLGACEKAPPSTSAASAGPSASVPALTPPATSSSAAAVANAKPIVAMPPASETAPLAKASNAFGFALYRKIEAHDNVAMSPASISSAVAMSYGGARGSTAEEIRKVFHFAADTSAVMTSWGRLQRALSSPDRPLVLNVANRLFGAEGFEFRKDYLDRTRVAFGAELERLDFFHAPEPSTAHINSWVEQQTQGRIQNLIPFPVARSTKLVLVNAIYFLAKWAQPFQKQGTMPGDFTLASGAKKKTPMMHQRASLRYARVPGGALLELPYKEDVASMIVVLPDRVDGLAALEASMDAAKLDAWRAQETEQLVDVTLPKFEIKPPSILLSKALKALGMPTSFDREKADFTGIAAPADPQQRLYLEEAVHQAFVKVDEEGTEAAGATALLMGGGGGAPPKVIQFVADHPFFFAIIDHASGLILFDGRLAAP